MVRVRILSFLFAFIIVFGITNASGQLTVEEVDLGDGALARYRKPPGDPSDVAFLAIHRTAGFRNHQSTTELANRGFGTLGIRTRFGNSEAAVNWELIALDIRNGIRFLKDVKGHTHVILIGHSGGGPSTSYFQAVAENGPSYCKGSNKLTECPFTGAEFTLADRASGIVFTDAHPGNPINRLRSLNASVVHEDQPFGPVKKTLDPFSEANGFNPGGDSVFSDHFVDKYSKAQSRRMDGLIKKALKIRREIERGKRDPADDAFVIFRTRARLSDFSTGVHRGTLEPRKLLKDDDGSIDETQVINTVRVPDPGNKQDDERSILNLTITSFLSANAIRSKHSLDDVDWCSSNNSTVCAVREISVPILVVTAQGHYFIRDGEQIYEESASEDKDYIVIEGMTHNLGNCDECAAFHGTGPYMNVPLNLWNYVADWANARF